MLTELLLVIGTMFSFINFHFFCYSICFLFFLFKLTSVVVVPSTSSCAHITYNPVHISNSIVILTLKLHHLECSLTLVNCNCTSKPVLTSVYCLLFVYMTNISEIGALTVFYVHSRIHAPVGWQESCFLMIQSDRFSTGLCNHLNLFVFKVV